MPKPADKFEDFVWPWTKGEIDEEKAARLLWRLTNDVEAEKAKTSEARSKVTEVEGKLTAAETKVVELEEKDLKPDEKLVRENERLKQSVAQKAGAPSGGSTDAAETIRLRVALRKGLTETQAKRLVGSTEEELTADADVLLTDLGKKAPDPKNEHPEDEGTDGRQTGGSGRPVTLYGPPAGYKPEDEGADANDPAKLRELLHARS